MKTFVATIVVHVYARNHGAFTHKKLKPILFWAKSQISGGEFTRIVGQYKGIS